MTLQFMRKVDYWCGIPLTWITGLLLTPIEALLGRRRRPNATVAKRVLFIELSEMGSVILADPAIQRVGKTRRVYFLIFRKNAPSLSVLNRIPKEQIFTLRDDHFLSLVIDVVRFITWCRRERIDCVVDLEMFSRFTALLSAVTFAPVRIGFFNPHSEGLYRGRLLTHPVAYSPHHHIAKNFVALTEPLFSAAIAGDPLIRRPISDDEIRLETARPGARAQETVLAKLRDRTPEIKKGDRLILVNANAGDFLPQRKWPQSSFTTLVDLLLDANPQAWVLLTGSPKERPEIEQIARAVGKPRAVNIAGDLDFHDLPALYSLAEILITNDSGPAHFAAAVGLPTYVFFGPETPSLYEPLGPSTSFYAGLACSPCVSATNHRDTRCLDNQCLKQIRPSQVFARIQFDFEHGRRTLDCSTQAERT